MPKQVVEEAIPEVQAVEQELALLRGFRDLVAEGLGYYVGSKAIGAEASEKTKEQRKKVNSIRKEINSNIEEWIKNADLDSYTAKMTELAQARATLKEAMKPFNEKRKPLNKAWRYCLNVAFPDALKELGSPVQPRFSLSNWIKEAIEKKK